MSRDDDGGLLFKMGVKGDGERMMRRNGNVELVGDEVKCDGI